MIIQHNLMAMTAHRNFNVQNKQIAKSLERLSSGFKLNRAADDPAGLGISEQMKAQIRNLETGIVNAMDVLAQLRIRDGQLQIAQDIVHRMKELSVQAANDTLSDHDRKLLDTEYQELLKELGSILGFSGADLEAMEEKAREQEGNKNRASVIDGAQAILETDGSIYRAALEDGKATFQLADGSSITLFFGDAADGYFTDFDIRDGTADLAGLDGFVLEDWEQLLNADQLDFSSDSTLRLFSELTALARQSTAFSCMSLLAGSSLTTRQGALDASDALNLATRQVNLLRAQQGAQINAVESSISQMEEALMNARDSLSTIRDADMAKEMMNFTKANIVAQAAQAMISQAMHQQRTLLETLLSTVD